MSLSRCASFSLGDIAEVSNASFFAIYPKYQSFVCKQPMEGRESGRSSLPSGEVVDRAHITDP